MSETQPIPDDPDVDETAATEASKAPAPRPDPRPGARRAPQRSKQRAPQKRLTRQKVADDVFAINTDNIPDGMSYEFKRHFFGGKEDRRNVLNLEANHWRSVPASRHPNEFTEDPAGKLIIRGGQVLMERPDYLTQEAHEEARQNALEQPREQLARLDQEDFGPAFRNTGAKVKQTWERGAIPDDDE